MKTRTRDWTAAMLCALLLSGCASTGARISQEDLKNVREDLKNLSIDHFADSIERVETVRIKVAQHLPQGNSKSARVILPFWFVTNHPELQKHYQTSGLKSPVFMGFLGKVPENLAELQRGDEIVTINGARVKTAENLDKILQRHKSGDEVSLMVRRQFKVWEVRTGLREIPNNIPVLLNSGDAQARFIADDRGFVYITAALLRELENDDELATVIASASCLVNSAKNRKFNIGYLGGLSSITASNMLALYMGWNSELFTLAHKPDFTNSGRFASKEEVFESDKQSLSAVFDAGYDPRRGLDFWMRQAEKKRPLLGAAMKTLIPNEERMVLMEQALESILNKADISESAAEATA